MNAALVPKHVIPRPLARSHSAPGPGTRGCRRRARSRRRSAATLTQEVPHHPAGRREPEEPVTRAAASRWRCGFFRCSIRIPPCPWTIGFGSPVVPELYSTHSGWSNGSCAKLERASSLEERVRHLAQCRRGRAERERARRSSDGSSDAARLHPSRRSKSLPAVAVAVDREQHLRLDLREAIDHAARRRIGRARRPDGADRRARQERRHGLGDVRHVRGDAVALGSTPSVRRPRRSPRSRAASRPSVHSPRRPELGGVKQSGRGIILAPEDVLGVAQPRPGEPLGPGHLQTAEHALAGDREPDVEERDDRRPEPLDVVDRPSPQIAVAVEANAPGLLRHLAYRVSVARSIRSGEGVHRTSGSAMVRSIALGGLFAALAAAAHNLTASTEVPRTGGQLRAGVGALERRRCTGAREGLPPATRRTFVADREPMKRSVRSP